MSPAPTTTQTKEINSILTLNLAEVWQNHKLIRYWKDVRGQIKQKYSTGNEIRFQTGELKIDIRRQIIELKDQVSLQRGNIQASAQKGEIHLSHYNKKLKYYALSDDISIVEQFKKDGKPMIRRAYGEKLEGYPKDRKIVLSGSPRLIQGENIINASRITFFEDTDTVEIDDPAAQLKL